jgi:hypothetical protein
MLRNQLVRLLRRAAERRVLALVVFVVAAAAQFWAMRVPLGGDLPDTIAAPAGAALTLTGLAGEPPLLNHQGSGSIDVRFERARLAPDTAQLLAQLGVTVPDADGPISWVTTSGAEGISVLDVARADAAAAVGVLTLRVLSGSSESVAQFGLEADAPLRVKIGTSLVPGAPGSRKLLRVGAQEVKLDGALPLQVLVPASAPMRAVLPLGAAGDVVNVSVGALRERATGDAGLIVRGIGVRAEDGRYDPFACGAASGRLLWRGAATLARGRCPGAGTLQVEELRIGAEGIEAITRGTGWAWRDGAPLGPTLFERLTDNPALAALVMLGDALVAGWLLLALLSLRRTVRYRVFLSYRRGDSAGHAGRLYDRLVETLGRGAVFIDVEKIPPGSYFEQVIARRIADAESVLVVIAPDWLTTRDAAGRRRLDVPEDFVRREVEMALGANKRVIPVLVGGAPMPAESDLPASIRTLARLSAVVITHASFERDADALADVLDERPNVAEESRPADA